jgi:hypothetical protein
MSVLQAEVPVCLVTALRCEARPLVERYRLEAISARGPFPVFIGPSLALVVTGVGKLAAAGGTAYLAAQLQDPTLVGWLNVGIAGHGNLAVGEPRLAHRVKDQASGRSWYPLPLPPDKRRSVPPSCEIVTVDQVELGYPEPVLYDMEAAGFVAMATRFCDVERVQCLKVVSDSPESEVEQLDRQKISSLIEENRPAIESVIEQLGTLALERRQRDRIDARLMDRYLDVFRLTVTQQRQLEVSLRRWLAFDSSAELWSDALEQTRIAVVEGRLSRPGKKVLTLVQQEVERLELRGGLMDAPC